MISEVRVCLDNIGPLRESFSPPFVILGNRMKLRKIKRNCTHTRQRGLHNQCLHFERIKNKVRIIF